MNVVEWVIANYVGRGAKEFRAYMREHKKTMKGLEAELEEAQDKLAETHRRLMEQREPWNIRYRVKP